MIKTKIFNIHSLISQLSVIALLVTALWPISTIAKELRHTTLANGTDLEYTVYKAKGDTLFLWLYSDAGPQTAEDRIAQELVKKSIEVWRLDLFASHFLPVARSSMDRIPKTDVSHIITLAAKQTGKKIIALTGGRGVLPVLEGVHHWLSTHKNQSALSGVILMSPNFYVETPEPGIKGKLLSIVQKTNASIFILQPKKSPWYWKLDETIPALEKSGSDVIVKRINGVRGRYYFRPDADDFEKAIAKKLPRTLKSAANYLKALPHKYRKVSDIQSAQAKIKVGKKDRQLTPYKGNPIPAPLILNDLNKQAFDLKQYKGQVVLVNFWASWCPPCVHEMPSMQRIQDRFISKGFTILGVNMAEERKTITEFLNTKVNVNFPILLDEDGAVLKNWGVFAFPTSYIIGKKGKIRYAIVGGVDWEKESMTSKIIQLLEE